MTDDLLTAQAAIKSRRQVVRDQSGQFRRRDVTVALKLAAERMKAQLRRELDEADHAKGIVRVKPHFRPLPAPDRLAVEHTGEVLPLFERQAA